MAKNPKISVVMPCYNVEDYLEECLDSILNQTFKDFEIICVDDGSTDNTLKILKSYEKKYKNIIVLTQKNKSAGAARNYGLTKATGDFVLFMDSDDFLEGHAFDVFYGITEKESADIYFYNFQTFDDKTKEVVKKSMFNNLDKSFSCDAGKFRYATTSFEQRKEFFIWSYVAPWNKLYNREFVLKNKLKFDEIFSTNDRTFYFSSLVKSEKLVTIDAVLINYRINNSGSLTGTYNESKFTNRKLAYESTMRFIDKEDKLLNETFFKVTILDFVLFLHKADEQNKYKVFLKTAEFFRSIDVSNIECIHSQSDKFGFWYNLIAGSDYLKDKQESEIVPVVFATNDKYAPYLSVTIESLIKNCSKDKFYDIYVFHSSLSELVQYKLLTQATENVHIKILNVLPIVNDIKMYSKGYYSVEMYYRILIPEILYQYKKVLYLDCDIAIQADVSELYDTDVSNHTLAAIRNDLVSKEMIGYVKNILKLDTEKYFNSGVLVINVNKFVEEDIKSQCFKILAKYARLACPDQDILNLTCDESTLYLDNTWNFQTTCDLHTNEDRYTKHYNIIHYITGNKPWNKKDMPLAEVFWKYARNTPFYEDIISTYLSSTLKLSANNASSQKAEPQRNVINDPAKMHYPVINAYQEKKKCFLSWPFRMFGKFFVSLKRYGFKATIKYTGIKIKYVINRILGKVDKYNNSTDINKNGSLNKRSYEYYKNLPVEDYKKELESWYNRNSKSAHMDIDNPNSFNQKIQWLKLNDSTIIKSHLSDKWLAKEYIKAVLGEKYIIKTLGVYDRFEDINFDELPNQFVIKSTHGSAQIIIVKDKSSINLEEIKEKTTEWLKINYAFKGGFELHYYNMIPRIIIEEFVEGINNDLYDYKFMCINGKVEFIWVDSDRFVSHKRNLYDLNWNLLPVKYNYETNTKNIPKPKQLKKLIKLSEKLAQDFALVRCDFYVLQDNSIKFGELTFTSCSGMDRWNPVSYDIEFGNKLTLPKPTEFKKLTRKQILKSEKEFLKSLQKIKGAK